MTDPSELPNVSASPSGEERMELITSVVEEAAECLDVSLDDSPDSLVAAVDACVRAVARGEGPDFPEDAEVELLLACLWGAQLVRAFGWSWVDVTFHDFEDAEALGVVSPGRKLVIYPWEFVIGCIENGVPVTIELAFNMLEKPDDIPHFEDDSFVDVMEHVHHIVPPVE